jgi:hypothetical protein
LQAPSSGARFTFFRDNFNAKVNTRNYEDSENNEDSRRFNSKECPNRRHLFRYM